MDSFDLFWGQVDGIDCVRLARQDAEDMFGKDVPVIVFANVGRQIVTNFKDLTISEKAVIFQAIEDGVNLQGTALSTSLTTGLLEAMHAASKSQDVNWTNLSCHLGEKSKAYVSQWLAWSA